MDGRHGHSGYSVMEKPGQDSPTSAGGSDLVGKKEREPCSHAPTGPQGRGAWVQDGSGGSGGRGFRCSLYPCFSGPPLHCRVLPLVPCHLASHFLRAPCLFCTSELCLPVVFLFPRLSSLRWPCGPDSPSALPLGISLSSVVAMCLSGSMFPVADPLSGTVTSPFLVLGSVGPRPIYRQAALRGGANPGGHGQGLWEEG